MLGAAGHRAVAAGQRRPAAARRGAGRPAVRRARRRAVELPAALDVDRRPARRRPCSTSRRTTSTGTARWSSTPPTRRCVWRGGAVAVVQRRRPCRRRARGRARQRCRTASAFTLGAPGPGQLGVARRHPARVDLCDRCSDPIAAPQQGTGGRSGRRAGGRRRRAAAGAAQRRQRARGRRAGPQPRHAGLLRVPPEAVRAGLRAFDPGAHRIAHVATVDGVAYVDDSKATNPHAAAASLRRSPHVVWIAGGLAKGGRFDELVAGSADRLRGVVLIGQDRALVAEALARHAPEVPVVEVVATDTGAMDDVVRAAAALAAPGRHRAARAGLRVDGHVPRLRRARRRLRRRGAPAPRRTAGLVTTYAPSPGLRAPGENGARRAVPADASRPRLAAAPPADVVLPGARRQHPAARARPGDGLLGVERRRVRVPRLVVGDRQQAGDLGRHRAAADVVRLAAAGAGLADAGLPRAARRRSALLVLVAVAGTEVNGNRNWLDFGGPFRLQPSELAKLALVLWGADLLARKERLLGQWKHLLVPLLPVGGLILVLVLLGGDLGTAIILAGGPRGAAVGRRRAGPPLRAGAGPGRAGRRVDGQHPVDPAVAHHRLAAPRPADPLGNGLQALHGKFALASGGWWGVGLGGVQEKWGALPEAHTDFIFAIIGEELGLVGTLAVLALFGRHRLRRAADRARATEPFVRLAAAGVTAWLLVQALVNIGAVLGLLPITGIPLPLVSYGGSALLPTMLGARHAAVLRPAGCAAHRPAAAGCCRRAAAGPAAGPPGGDGSGARRPRRRRDRRPHRACPGPRRRAAPPRPVGRGHRARHRARAGDPARPGPRLRPGADPAGAAAAPPAAGRCSRVPGRLRGRRRGRRARCCATGDADVVVGFGGYVVRAGLPRRPAAAGADRRARGQRPARAGQPARRAAHAVRRHDLPRHAARARPARRHAAPAQHRHPRPGRHPRRGARAPSGWTPTGRPCWSPAARRAPSGSTTRPPARPTRPARRRRPGAARHRAGAHRDGRRRRGRRRTSCCPTSTGWSSPTPPPTWRCAGPAPTPCAELTAVGLPAAYVPLPIGNGEQGLERPAGGRGRRRPARRRRRTAPPAGCATR